LLFMRVKEALLTDAIMADKAKEIQKKETDSVERVEHTRATQVYTPDVDIIEREDCIVVTADMPGVDENAIDITLEKNVLTLYGKVDIDLPERLKLLHAEYGIGDYKRVFTLSGEIDRDKIDATVKNGVLKVLLPKAEAVKTRKIEVRAEV